MENYYKLLNVSESASYDAIKRAYRKMALKYHPDRNQDNQSATEKFKLISIAYDTLSSPAKRSRYDAKLEYAKFHKTTRSTSAHTTYTRTTQSNTQRKSQRRKRQKTNPNPVEPTIPKTKLTTKQFWTLLTFSTIVVFGIIGTAHYSELNKKRTQEQREIAAKEALKQYIDQLEISFNNGDYVGCITLARESSEKLQALGFRHDEVGDIQYRILNIGVDQFYAENYPETIKALEALVYAGNESVRTDYVYALLGRAYYKNNQLDKIYELLVSVQTNNYPEIPTLLAIVSRDLNNDVESAILWHNDAKRILKEKYQNMGFQFVPNDAPQTHFNAYYQSAITNFNLKKYRNALDDLGGALFLRSANRDALYMKGLCELELGMKNRACVSFNLAKKNGNVLAEEQLKNCL